MLKNKKIKYYLTFTLIFIAMLPLIYYSFLANQKSLVWNRDALRQHYNSLVYFGKWGRQIIKNIFLSHKFEIPLWDFHIGYGSDIITTFHYYVIGDPLSLFSIFVPSRYTEYLYGTLILLRLYLSGISFSFYCRQMGKSDTATLGAALQYVFCGYMLYAGVRHPYFVNPMIYLPLLLTGAERIFQKKKPTLFIFMVFISAASNFYFFYMIVLAVCLYVAVRFFTFRHTDLIKEIFSTIIRFAGFAIIGLSMAAVILCPVLIQFFKTNRLDSRQSFPFLYNWGYYLKMIPSYLEPGNFGYWTVLGFMAPALLAAFILFGTKKKYLHLKISFCILTAMLFIPFFGRAFNGFSYVSNRWCWIYAAFLSYITATVWDDMVLFKNTSKRFVLSASALYLILFTLAQIKLGNHRFIPAVCLISILVIAVTACHFEAKKYMFQAASAGFILITLFHACFNAYYLFSPKEKKYATHFVNTGTALNHILETAPGALKHIPKTNDNFYRYETNDLKVLNSASIVGESGVQYYWSLENRLIPKYLKDMSLRSFVIHNYKDLDHRTFLDALASVKYFVQKGSCDIPYGYEYRDTICLTEENKYQVYENQYALPLGYTYDSYIPNSKFKSMEAWQRQEALLEGIVIAGPDSEKESLKNFPETKLELKAQSIDYEITYGKKIKLQSDGSLKVKKNKAKMTLTFAGQKNCETYLSIQDAKVEPKNSFHNDLNLIICSNDSKNKMRYMSKTHRNFKDQKNYLINLGYHENPQTKITITFPKKGTYKFGSIKVICQPMEHYKDQIKERKSSILEHEKIGTNTVTGNVDLPKDKILCLSIPYSHGWHARVDGTEKEVLRANGMYMALTLEKGEHEIELRYQTPGLITGFWISMLGFAACIAVCINYKKKYL